MRLAADRSKCVTAGLCVLTAPEVFSQDEEEGTVVLLVTSPPPGLADRVAEAVNLCPSRAIQLVEDPSTKEER